MLLLQGRTFEKFNFSSVNQVSSVVLCSSELAFFFKLLFAMIFLQSWLVLKAVVTGLGHTVFFLFIGVKEVFMLHNSPICISSVYWPSALKILQPRPAAKPKIQYWYWDIDKSAKLLKIVLGYIPVTWIQILTLIMSRNCLLSYGSR